MEMFIAIFAALTLHSLVQALIVEPLTTLIKIRNLRKATDALIEQTHIVNKASATMNVANLNRINPDRLEEIFQEEMRGYTGRND